MPRLLPQKHSDDEKRIQELLEQNAQLDLENQRRYRIHVHVHVHVHVHQVYYEM